VTVEERIAKAIYDHQMFAEYGHDKCECGELVGYDWDKLAAHQAARILDAILADYVVIPKALQDSINYMKMGRSG
jgi:hypothetical protein